MADNQKTSVLKANLEKLGDLDNFQKYILGTKCNGQPRAVYDVVRECTGIGRKKKKKSKKNKKKADVPVNQISFYTGVKKKKHKKKKGKGGKHWHIDG